MTITHGHRRRERTTRTLVVFLFFSPRDFWGNVFFVRNGTTSAWSCSRLSSTLKTSPLLVDPQETHDHDFSWSKTRKKRCRLKNRKMNSEGREESYSFWRYCKKKVPLAEKWRGRQVCPSSCRLWQGYMNRRFVTLVKEQGNLDRDVMIDWLPSRHLLPSFPFLYQRMKDNKRRRVRIRGENDEAWGLKGVEEKRKKEAEVEETAKQI